MTRGESKPNMYTLFCLILFQLTNVKIYHIFCVSVLLLVVEPLRGVSSTEWNDHQKGIWCF